MLTGKFGVIMLPLMLFVKHRKYSYAKAVFKFAKLNTAAQQREAVYSGAKPIALPATV
jgi:hypothetical protein